jgi:hypothetical protein
MLKIKGGVTLHGLSPQMLLAVIAVKDIYDRRGKDVVLTSGNDGKHSVNSKHYVGNALDFRTNNLDDPTLEGPIIANELNKALGRDYDVLFEGDHIHIEYDPKRPV